MKPRAMAAGLQCPAVGHGPLLDVDGALYCPHVAHDGRPRSHALGPSQPTRSRFSMTEVLTPTPVPAP